MDNATIFYILGGALAVCAVIFSLVGLKFERFPGRAAPFIALAFMVLVGFATTYAVFHGQDEDTARAVQAR